MLLGVRAGSIRGWRTDKLRRFPELHFSYEEEAAPEDFFVPYVWTFVVTHSAIPWNAQAIALFSPLSTSVSASSLDRLDTSITTRASTGSDAFA